MLANVIVQFIREFWREIFIVGLAAGFWGLHSLYYMPQIDNLTLAVEVAELKEQQCKTEFKTQTDAIIEESSNTSEMVKNRFDRLETLLQELTRTEQEQVQDILDETVPESNCEELNIFLIDMVEKLGWQR